MTTKQTDKSTADKIGDVLNKAKEGLSAFGETVATKSKEMMDTAKLNTQKMQLEKENDDHFRELGTMAHNKGKLTGDMKAVSQKITENEAKIKEVEKQLEEVKKAAQENDKN